MGDHRADVANVVSETFRLDPAEIALDAPLEELGIDSKGRIKLLSALEIYHDVKIDLDQLGRFTDIGSVAEVLAEALGDKAGVADERR
ncbi:acyl carrier protein [Amycolatopsis orientalis]|uniref:Acyl carrier protein n=1 Tax=Amycolatopsis orientalis TaxID=31958 RepID=A0A193C2K3_AMYOR|nr:acyl carrier protein [Amycolatopsis orientalis]ANN18761.1 acyl carrier protein [Amycolatopsis orientalis]